MLVFFYIINELNPILIFIVYEVVTSTWSVPCTLKYLASFFIKLFQAQHFLYFLPEPQGQESFLPTFALFSF